jgi:hypothetical protein
MGTMSVIWAARTYQFFGIGFWKVAGVPARLVDKSGKGVSVMSFSWRSSV